MVAEQILDVLVPEMVGQLVKQPKTVSVDRIQERTAEQTVEAPDITLAEKIIEGPVNQTQQVVNTSVQHVVDTGEVEKHIIHEKINQVTRHVEIPLLQIVKKTVEVPGVPLVARLPFTDKVVDIPVVAQRQISRETVQKSTETPQLRYCDQVVDVPVKLAAQVPRVLVVEKTTEIPQFGAAELLKFNTSKPGNEQISLKEYVDRMKEGQNDIFYTIGESIAVVSSSPFLENLRKNGYEALYVADSMDEYAVHQPTEFGGRMLKSTTKERSDLGDEDEKKTLEELNTEPKPLTKLMKHILADKVEMAMVSDRIVDSTCVLTTSEYGWSAKMERIMEAQALRDISMISHMVSKKTMEVNPAAWEQQHKQQQQQQQRECSKPQPTKQSTRQERGGERKEEERDQEGRKEEERKVEERGEQVEEDVTGWTEVTRKRRRKMIQIFVRVNGSKATPMEVSLTDDRVEDVMRRIQNEEDVYVTLHGRILKRGEKLRSCEVTDGCTIQVTSRMRGGGKHKDKKSKIEKERSGSPKKIEQAQGQKAEVEPSRNVDEMYVRKKKRSRKR